MKGADPRLMGGPGGVTAARLLAYMLLGCVLGLLLGSRPLALWAGRLPPGWEAVQTAAAAWDGAMDRAGLTAPYDAVHAALRQWTGG